MTTQINATQMQQGDVISFYGAEFTLCEVKSRNVGTEEEVFWAKGVCKKPSQQMIDAGAYFTDDRINYQWQFQGNANRTLTKVN